METKYDICNRALTEVGANPISSFDDGTAEAIAAGKIYEPLVLEALGGNPRWRFAADQAELAMLNDTPLARFSFAYQLPGGLITLHAVTQDDDPIHYQRYGATIFTNASNDATPLVADFTFRQDESLFPPQFKKALGVELKAAFADGLARDKAWAAALRKEAEEVWWPKARSADSQQQTARKLGRSRLVTARGIRGSRWR